MRPDLFRAVAAVVATSYLILSAPADDLKSKPKPPAHAKLAKLPAGLTQAKVKAHVLEPAHLKKLPRWSPTKNKTARLKLPAELKIDLAFKHDPSRFVKPPEADLVTLRRTAHALLKDKVAGYMLQVFKDGNSVVKFRHNNARTPTDGTKAWSENAQMHVASVSKWLAAVALMKALDAARISYDARIITYLPAYWKKGRNIDKITFRHLLTHTSGFNSGVSATNFAVMKKNVAAGVAKVGDYDYENMNFSLIRVLLPVVTGNLRASDRYYPILPFGLGEQLNDASWDLATIGAFRAYMQSKVFTPAGLGVVSYGPTPKQTALAYLPSPGSKAGWDSGDHSVLAGTVGFRLSTREVLTVMHHVRRKGTILSAAKARLLLDSSFGIDQTYATPAGKMYVKSGYWSLGTGETEQCVIAFLPGGLEMALFINSKIGPADAWLPGVAEDIYRAALRGRMVDVFRPEVIKAGTK